MAPTTSTTVQMTSCPFQLAMSVNVCVLNKRFDVGAAGCATLRPRPARRVDMSEAVQSQVIRRDRVVNGSGDGGGRREEERRAVFKIDHADDWIARGAVRNEPARRSRLAQGTLARGSAKRGGGVESGGVLELR